MELNNKNWLDFLPKFQDGGDITPRKQKKFYLPHPAVPHFQGGGKISTEGYKKNSPDKHEPFLTIPSNNITMKGVEKPLMAFPEVGNPIPMFPGQEYYFPESRYIHEVPISPINRATTVHGVHYQQGGSFNDSLNLYNAYVMQDKLMGKGSNPVSTGPGSWDMKTLKDNRVKKIVKGLENYGPIANDFQSQEEQFKDGYGFTARKEDKKLLNYYKSLHFDQPTDIMYHTSPDLIHSTIQAIGTYFDGSAQSPIYKKPIGDWKYRNPQLQQGNFNVYGEMNGDPITPQSFPAKTAADSFATKMRQYQKGGPIQYTSTNQPAARTTNASIVPYAEPTAQDIYRQGHPEQHMNPSPVYNPYAQRVHDQQLVDRNISQHSEDAINPLFGQEWQNANEFTSKLLEAGFAAEGAEGLVKGVRQLPKMFATSEVPYTAGFPTSVIKNTPGNTGAPFVTNTEPLTKEQQILQNLGVNPRKIEKPFAPYKERYSPAQNQTNLGVHQSLTNPEYYPIVHDGLPHINEQQSWYRFDPEDYEPHQNKMMKDDISRGVNDVLNNYYKNLPIRKPGQITGEEVDKILNDPYHPLNPRRKNKMGGKVNNWLNKY